MTDIGPVVDWGVFLSDEDKRICSEYDGCEIPFHECMFFLIGYHLPFSEYEFSVKKHLLIDPTTTSSELGIC